MSEVEAIIRQEAGVKAHESQSPPTVGLKAGAFADVGTLILTNKRLVYIDKGGAARAAAWAVGGVFAAQAIENRVSKAEIDELSKREGSYAMPLQSITRVEAGKKMGQSYISVDCSGLSKPTHAYVVSGGSNNRDWVTAINQAKNRIAVCAESTANSFYCASASAKRLCSKATSCFTENLPKMRHP